MIKAPVSSKGLLHLVNEPEKGKEEFYSQYQLNGRESLVMFHCRAKTHGTQKNNYNNMPIRSSNFILIHNGIVHATKMEGYKYQGEVDSEEILAQIEKHGIRKGLSCVGGSMAVVIKPVKENWIYIFRNTNPIVTVYHSEYKMLVGCSSFEYMPYTDEDVEYTANLFQQKLFITQPYTNHLYRISTTSQEIQNLGNINISKDDA
jgi:predicted glutamine amidotransferase